ncbi:MAG: hypothetical protein HN736_13290 [Anaerolineae bacterium]|mgnify:CR=1 FL=1|jgi:hypothetical protein|nr:hypothetical protein [Anaerolineae bacterium]MBT3714770.1 hypothetical protein [Anaerolineae bacterium]MBT4311146.1 hypothetical protein [Anaerolineae bacterium]MBT4457594.1 hypothetical protein [Anaerolineae bacterium]MBT4841761.1 hypothetical protein [Anaerolineae bacterium]
MADERYEYEVAFSFVKDDEAIATALNDLLQDRLSTFLYSKRQEELAGTDGEQSFNEIFSQKSRIVVVIYRNEWGDSPWTRIEETAIRNRAYEEGYAFVIFIPVEDSAKLPRWLPKTQLWVGFKRWGLEGAASVIEARVQEAGGEPREESATDKAARMQRQIDAEVARKAFLNSIEGVKAALEEVNNLFAFFESISAEIRGKSGFEINCKRVNDRKMDICAIGYCLAIDWNYSSWNTLDRSYLSISTWNGLPPRSGRNFLEKPKQVSKSKFNFDRKWTENVGWVDSGESQFLSTERLAEYILKKLMGRVHKGQVGKRNS